MPRGWVHICFLQVTMYLSLLYFVTALLQLKEALVGITRKEKIERKKLVRILNFPSWIYIHVQCTLRHINFMLFSADLIFLPPGHQLVQNNWHVAGRLASVWVRLRGQSFGGDPLLTTAGWAAISGDGLMDSESLWVSWLLCTKQKACSGRGGWWCRTPRTGWWRGWSPAHWCDSLSLSLQLRGNLNCSDGMLGLVQHLRMVPVWERKSVYWNLENRGEQPPRTDPSAVSEAWHIKKAAICFFEGKVENDSSGAILFQAVLLPSIVYQYMGPWPLQKLGCKGYKFHLRRQQEIPGG